MIPEIVVGVNPKKKQKTTNFARLKSEIIICKKGVRSEEIPKQNGETTIWPSFFQLWPSLKLTASSPLKNARETSRIPFCV